MLPSGTSSSLEMDCTNAPAYLREVRSYCTLLTSSPEQLLKFENISFHELDQNKQFKYYVPKIKMFHKLERLW